MIADPIRQRIRELEDETLRMESQQGYRLGGVAMNQMSHTASGSSSTVVMSNNATDVLSARELAWAAAERRAREQKEKEKRNDKV
mmetsp:Transcript_14944/g.16141  ORF Transcript_14944/g.16141 Transcript_14944/m.16141 type:complete len:85 (-) Transcript_14944:126-380(-)